MRLNKGFTLVEIMIVIAIIGLLAAIAIPNFLRARRESQAQACRSNMEQIYGAKQEWAFKKRATDEPGTADELLAEMDSHGVEWSVLVQTSWSTWDNGYIADSVARFPDRFIGHGLIDPQDPENADQVRYWMQERGLAGFRFHPIYYPGEKILLTRQNEPMWEAIAGLNAIIQFHLRPDFADQVDAIARRYPRLTLIIDHMGYPKVDEDPAAFRPILDLARHSNVYLKLSDVAGRSRQGFPYTDVHPFIKDLLSAFGSERMVWGTGYPGHHRLKHKWPTLAQELRLVREGLPFLTDTDKERILGGAAAKVWKLA